MWASILGLVTAILAFIPKLVEWFTKTPAQKEEEAKKTVDEQEDKFDKTGRPQ